MDPPCSEATHLRKEHNSHATTANAQSERQPNAQPSPSPLFALTNCPPIIKLSVERLNNRPRVTAQNGRIKYTAMESRLPAHFAVVEEAKCTENAIPARHLQSTVFFEIHSHPVGVAEGLETTARTFTDLVDELGGRAARERMKRRNATPQTRSQPLHINVETSILPPFDATAATPLEALRFDLLFSPAAQEAFAAVSRPAEEVLQTLRPFLATPALRPLCYAADCLYILLSMQMVRRDSFPPPYRFFFDEVAPLLSGRRLSALEYDRHAVRLYALLLIITKGQCSYAALPKFAYTKPTLLLFLKALGCGVSSGGIVTLRAMPTESYIMRNRQNAR